MTWINNDPERTKPTSTRHSDVTLVRVCVGLLLLAVILLIHGIAAVLVSMTGFESHVKELYPILVTSLHPISLLTVLLPNMFPGSSVSGTSVLLINHSIIWQLASVPAGKGSPLRSVMQMEVLAAVYVCVWVRNLPAGDFVFRIK